MKLEKGLIVNCKTKEESLEFLSECFKQNIKLATDVDTLDLFGEDTCYTIRDESTLICHHKNYYNGKHPIIDFKDLFKLETDMRVGDIVVATNIGRQFPNYTKFIKDNLEERVSDFVYGYPITVTDKEYEVIFIGRHERDGRLVAIIEDSAKQVYVMGIKGLKIVKKKNDKNKKHMTYEMPQYVENEVKKVIVNDRTVVVILNSGFKGVATCSKDDEFIEEIGYKIALLRARINKQKEELRIKERMLKRICDNPNLINDYFII